MKSKTKLSKLHKVLIALAIAIVVGIPVLGLLRGFGIIRSTQTTSTSFPTVGGRAGNNTMMQEMDYAMDEMMADDGEDIMIREEMMAKFDSGISQPIPANEGFTEGVERTIVKNANISMVVDDTRKTMTDIGSVTEQAGGTVTDSSVNEGQIERGIVYANMTLRVPVSKIESVLASIRQLGVRVTSENISSQDRTEQKIDLEAQLENLKTTEAQFQTIMSQAKTVEETLKVQRELSTVRGQIERLEARLENLLGDAAMSTIYVSLSTEKAELPIVEPNNRSIFQEVKIALRDALVIYRQLFVSGVRFVIIGAPILIIAGIGFWVWKKKK
jgi:hypothetical protein